MKCPFCGNLQDKVVDSRSCKDGAAIRRRRECMGCSKRYTTYEYIESFQTQVIKKDRRREQYDRDKLINGILIACKKRPVSIDTINKIADTVETQIESKNRKEIESIEIGKLIMKALFDVDQIAYIRFASVYREFKSADEFIEQVGEL